MKDLLEELLSVLAPPAGPNSTHHDPREVSLTQQLAPSNETAIQQTQINGFSTRQQTAPETARKTTEKMSQKTVRQSKQTPGQDIDNSAVNHGSSVLLTVAALSDSAIDQLLKAAQSSDISADPAHDAAMESLLFDAGVAVPEALGHRAFSTKDEPVREAFFEPDIELHPMPEASPEPDIELFQIPEASLNPDIELHLMPEESEAEIDESVMSAFDIGDFEADTHAAQADIRATEDSETNGSTADDAGFSDFDPDDFELDRFDLEAFDLDASGDREAPSDDEDADERLETADVLLDDLVSATEQNFLARWAKRLMGAKVAKPEGAESELSGPRLFESDYSHSDQRKTQPESAADRDAEYDADFYAESSLEPSLEFVSELSVDEAVSDALLVLEADEETDDPTVAEDFDSSEPPDVGERAEVIEPFELLEETEVIEPPESLENATVVELFDLDNFDLDTSEPDALDDSDEGGFDCDSLLEPLGEKAWLSEVDNANEALHLAAAAGDLSGVWAALAANASVNALGLAQRTALSAAIESGSVPVVEMLLEMCADPNLADVVNGSPRYPLMGAVTEAAEPVRDELMRLLLARGAEVNQVDAKGQTALMGAAERGYVEALRRLIESNADLDAQDFLGQTALLRAKGQGHQRAIALLKASSIDRERAIAFLKAVTQGDIAAVAQWLAAGMSANARVARMSALTAAAAKGEVAIAQLLIDAGAEIDYRFYETDPTPLFHAAYRGQLAMVALLLEAGASPRLSPHYPIGALDYAEIGRQSADDAAVFEPIVALLATLSIRPN